MYLAGGEARRAAEAFIAGRAPSRAAQLVASLASPRLYAQYAAAKEGARWVRCGGRFKRGLRWWVDWVAGASIHAAASCRVAARFEAPGISMRVHDTTASRWAALNGLRKADALMGALLRRPLMVKCFLPFTFCPLSIRL
jgi:hypothetical protein